MANSDRGRYRGYTEARKRANQKYDQTTDRLTVRLPKGDKKKLQDHCKRINTSVNAFIVEAIQENMDGC